jgi:hypothetical protein
LDVGGASLGGSGDHWGMGVTIPDELDRDIRFAIANKRLLELRYNGQARTVEPHDYGRHKGVVHLLAYQLRGASTAKGPQWRDFDVAKIEHCTVLDRTFPGSRGRDHRNHKVWDELWARVT